MSKFRIIVMRMFLSACLHTEEMNIENKLQISLRTLDYTENSCLEAKMTVLYYIETTSLTNLAILC